MPSTRWWSKRRLGDSRTFQKGNGVVLQIVDTGVGMSEEVRLYRSRFSPRKASTALASVLALSTALSAGTVEKSTLKVNWEAGTTVTVTLPIHKDEVVPEPEVIEVPGKLNKRIPGGGG